MGGLLVGWYEVRRSVVLLLKAGEHGVYCYCRKCIREGEFFVID